MAKTVNLIEEIGIIPHTTKVDRDRCVIRNVKVLGKESPNCHGLHDVAGTIYTMEAMQGALPHYEGKKIFIDHPERSNPNKERSIRDGVGKLFDPRIASDGIYADMHLVPSHEFTSQILDCSESEHLNDMFSLSHNAQGRGEVENGKFVVREIPNVRSVDLVSSAATTRSLFESREQKIGKNMANKKTLTLRELVEAKATEKVKNRWAKLLEDDDYGGMMTDMSSDDATADAPPPEPAAETEPAAGGMDADEMSHDEHLAHMLKAIVLDDSLDADTKVSKIKKALALIDDDGEKGGAANTETGAAAGGGGEEEEGGDEEEAETEESAADDEITKKKKEEEEAKKGGTKMESKERAELEQFRKEKKVRELCESLQFIGYDDIEFKALCALDGEDRKTYIRKAKERKTTKTAPRTVTPTTGVPRHIQESAETVTVIPGTETDTTKAASRWRA